MHVRSATPEEYDEIYQMGFDVWNAGQSLEAYLIECRASLKYASGRWYVLLDEHANLLSSLIIYTLEGDTRGLGSIATSPRHRKQGYASVLIQKVIGFYESEAIKKFFLFADIDASFYERFGFEALPASMQSLDHTVCMVRGLPIADATENKHFKVPQYF